MLNILEASREELTTLNHGPNIFHDALAKAMRDLMREAGMTSAALERVE